MECDFTLGIATESQEEAKIEHAPKCVCVYYLRLKNKIKRLIFVYIKNTCSLLKRVIFYKVAKRALWKVAN